MSTTESTLTPPTTTTTTTTTTCTSSTLDSRLTRSAIRCPFCVTTPAPSLCPRTPPEEIDLLADSPTCPRHGNIDGVVECMHWVCWACDHRNVAWADECRKCKYRYGTECAVVWDSDEEGKEVMENFDWLAYVQRNYANAVTPEERSLWWEGIMAFS